MRKRGKEERRNYRDGEAAKGGCQEGMCRGSERRGRGVK